MLKRLEKLREVKSLQYFYGEFRSVTFWVEKGLNFHAGMCGFPLLSFTYLYFTTSNVKSQVST